MKEIIEKFITQSVRASSGDNSQPWRFEVHDSQITIINLPEKDNPKLNYQQSGSLIAHGGLIENICLLAKSSGFLPKVEYLPDHNRPDVIAFIELMPSQPEQDELVNYISKRHTNRHPYSKKPLAPEEKSKLLQAIINNNLEQSIRLSIIEDKKLIKKAARAGSSVEQVILENKELHSLLFKDVLWTEKQHRAKISGLYIKSMEFPPPVKLVFWLASFWPLISILNKIGLAKFVAFQDSLLYQSCGAIIGIVCSNNGKKSFIEAGRALQRVWLAAESLNLAIQPVSATIFAGRSQEGGQASYLSSSHQAIIAANYQKLKSLFQVKGEETMAMMFRIGRAKPASARTLRFKPQINWVQ